MVRNRNQDETTLVRTHHANQDKPPGIGYIYNSHFFCFCGWATEFRCRFISE